LDPVFLGGVMVVTPRDLAMLPVPSVEQSSMTIISVTCMVCTFRLRIVSAMLSLSL